MVISLARRLGPLGEQMDVVGPAAGVAHSAPIRVRLIDVGAEVAAPFLSRCASETNVTGAGSWCFARKGRRQIKKKRGDEYTRLRETGSHR